ncbi:MAG: uroporphyrinogen-III synthase [Burkholderiales bacterium]
MPTTAATGRLRVLVTRPAAQASTWVRDLLGQGVDAVALPLIDIVRIATPLQLDAAWAGLHRFKLVMFVSPNAAAQFFATPSHQPWPAQVLAASPGPGTSTSLRAVGVPAGCVIEPASDAPQFDSEALWQQLKQHNWRGARVLVVAGEGGRDWLAQQLRACGAEVEQFPVYRRAPAVWAPPSLLLAQQALDHPDEHLWFFSSSEAIAQLIERFPQPLWARSQALTTHPRISQAAVHAGFASVTSCRAHFDAVVGCIQSLDIQRSPRLSLSMPPTRSQ